MNWFVYEGTEEEAERENREDDRLVPSGIWLGVLLFIIIYVAGFSLLLYMMVY